MPSKQFPKLTRLLRSRAPARNFPGTEHLNIFARVILLTDGAGRNVFGTTGLHRRAILGLPDMRRSATLRRLIYLEGGNEIWWTWTGSNRRPLPCHVRNINDLQASRRKTKDLAERQLDA